MVRFPATVPGNLRTLHDRQVRDAAAPLGRVAIGPRDGYIRVYDDTGTLMRLSAAGVQVRYRGTEVGLTPTLEGLDTRLTTATEANAAQWERIVAAEGVNRDQESRLSAATAANAAQWERIVASEGRLGGLEGRMGTAESTNAAQWERIVAVEGAARAAQSTANSASSRAGDAQSRADSAYSLAASKASSSDVSNAVATAKNYTDSRINALVTALRDQGIPVAV